MGLDNHARVIGVQGPANSYAVTIADGASLSGAVEFAPSERLSAILTPAGMEGTTLTFQVSRDGKVTWADFYDPSTGAEVSWTVAAGKDFANPNWSLWKDVVAFKIRTGTSASPQAQTGAATLTVIGAP